MTSILAALVLLATLPVTPSATIETQPPAHTVDRPGILLLAHGGAESWNENVREIARAVDATHPTEIAFGMATRANIQAAADRLAARGASEIVAVPLFVSSHSSVVRATEYLLGLRDDAPPQLAAFAKMSHGSSSQGGHTMTASAHEGDNAHAGHGSHGAAAADDGTKPIATTLPVRITPALNSHPLLGAIVADRARAISADPSREAVILVAHGPVEDDDNARWLADMRALGGYLSGYASVEVLSLRDDASADVRDNATSDLRAKVTAAHEAGREVLIVPVLLSYGGIERGVKARLEGLTYRIPTQGIAPDARLADWVMSAMGGR